MFYIEENGVIVLKDNELNRLKTTLDFMPQYADLPILETDKEIIELDGKFIFTDDAIRLQQIEIELMQADETYKIQLDTPVQYTNGHLYKPKWAEETYINLLTAGSMMPTMFPMQIWDSTEIEENVVLMTLEDLQLLTKYLASIQQHYFDERKVLKSQLLNEKKKLIAKTNNIQN
ncbi:hypothetical protein IKJ53_01355 [bacterium]|nr:hypothetical protein [bacterium]